MATVARRRSISLEEYIALRSRQMGLDPSAVLAVASTEGGFGGPRSAPGDSGTSFGPFQLHKGGALPAGVQNPQTWAWSKEGVDYALGRIDTVAHGQGGQAAVTSIVYKFERPADPATETKVALSRYDTFKQFSDNTFKQVPGISAPVQDISPLPTGSAVNSAARHIPGVAQVEGAVSGVSGLVSWVTKGKNVSRIGEVLAGAVLFLVGLLMIGKGLTATSAARQVRGAVA